MKHLFSQAEINARREQIVKKLVQDGVLDLNPISIDKYANSLSQAKTLSDIINRIDGFDPYRYEVKYCYGESFKYYGIIVLIQLKKEDGIVRLPLDGTAYDVPRDTGIKLKNIYSFTNTKNVKVYDGEGSIS